MTSDAPPKPAFSAFERRLDPTLAAEDANPVHEAFRRRRVLHGERGLATILSWRTLRLRIGGIGPFAWVLLVLALLFNRVFGIGNFLPFVLLAWGLFAIVRAAMGRAERGGGQQTVRLPTRLLPVVLAPVGRGTRGELDLWMTGASGETVAEALYLELRESSLVATIVAALCVGAGASAFYWRAVGEFRPGGILLTIALLWLAWNAALMVYAGSSATAWGRVAGIAAQWRRLAIPPTFRRSVDELVEFLAAVAAVACHRAARRRLLRAFALRLLRILGWTIAGVGAIAAIVLALVHARTLDMGPLRPAFDALYVGWKLLGWETFLGCVLLALAFRLPADIPRDIERAAKSRAAALRNFERSYNLYMAAVVAADPDAVAWVDMAWPEDRSRRATERLRALLAEAPPA